MEVREEFLGFVEAESTKGVALAEKFMTTQAEFGIEIRNSMYQKQCTSIAKHTLLTLLLVTHARNLKYAIC